MTALVLVLMFLLPTILVLSHVLRLIGQAQDLKKERNLLYRRLSEIRNRPDPTAPSDLTADDISWFRQHGYDPLTGRTTFGREPVAKSGGVQYSLIQLDGTLCPIRDLPSLRAAQKAGLPLHRH